MNKYLLFFLFFIAGCLNNKQLLAQYDKTIHLMQSIPQSNYTNPSFIPMGKWYFGSPMLSSLYLGYSNTAFRYRDVIHRRSQDDSLMIDPEKTLNTMHKKNYITFEVNEEILSGGFKIAKKNLFFNISLSEKASVRFCFPKDLFTLLWKGNSIFADENKSADFKWFGFNEMHYHELLLGIAKTINEKWTVGGHAKILLGLSNVYFKKSDISLYTNGTENITYDLTAKSNLEVHTSIPGLTIYKNAIGINQFDSVTFNSDTKYFLNLNNKGIAFDLGATFKPNDKFTFAASILDLGGIKWKTNVQNFTAKEAEVTFDGIDIAKFINYPDSIIEKEVREMGDSLMKHFEITKSSKYYWSPLNTIIFLTSAYNLTEKDKIGLLVRGDFFNQTVHPSVTATYNRKFFNWLYLTASYSYYNRHFNNIGEGFAILGGPYEFYVVSDNILGDIWPLSFQNISIHFGMNYIFGYKTKKNSSFLNKFIFEH